MTILWSRWLNRLKQKQGKAVARKRPRFLPRLEALEERYVPSTILTVNTTMDTHAANAASSPVDTNGNGEISLRSAIEFADLDGAGGDTIMTPAGTYALTLGALSVSNSMTIEGAGVITPGVTGTVIDASGQSDRVMTVTSTATTVTLQGLTLENGTAPTGSFSTNLGSNDSGGGAILDEGATNLNITNSVLTHNKAQGADATQTSAGAGEGGAVYQYGGTLTFTDSTVSNNTAQGGADNTGYGAGAGLGGGVYTFLGELLVQSSTFNGNNAFGGASSQSTNGGDGQGGAIDYATFGSVESEAISIPVAADLTVTDSTFNLNTAQGGNNTFGGGEGFGGSGSGGAIYDATFSDTASVTDTTIAGNAANAGTGAEDNGGGFGGGFYFAGGEGGTATASIGGTIIATNTASTLGQDVYTQNTLAPFTSLGNNLIGNNDETGDGFINEPTGNGDQVGGTATGDSGTVINPLLASLADNAGPTQPTLTQTMALQNYSPALGAGATHNLAGSVVPVDQRGISRPLGFQGDVGAYQSQEHTDDGGYTLVLELEPDTSNPTILEFLVNGVAVDARALSDMTQYNVFDTGTDSSTTDFLTVDYTNGFFSLPNGIGFQGDGTSRLTVIGPTGSFNIAGPSVSGPTENPDYELTPFTVVPPLVGPVGPIGPTAPIGTTGPTAPTPTSMAQIGLNATPPITYSGLYLLTVQAGSDVAAVEVDVHGTANATLVLAPDGNTVIRVASDSGLLGSVINGPVVVDSGNSSNILEVAEDNNRNSTGDTVAMASTEILGHLAGEIAGQGALPFAIYYTGVYQVVGLTTGSGPDNITLYSAAPPSQVGDTVIDAGGGGDTVTVDVTSSSLYTNIFLKGDPANPTDETPVFVDQTGGATFATLPPVSPSIVSAEQVSYDMGTDVSYIFFYDFGTPQTL